MINLMRFLRLFLLCTAPLAFATTPFADDCSRSDLIVRNATIVTMDDKSYFENSIVASAGSDVPVTPITPWWGIWSAVVRRELTSGQILAPEERLTIREALLLYTRKCRLRQL